MSHGHYIHISYSNVFGNRTRIIEGDVKECSIQDHEHHRGHGNNHYIHTPMHVDQGLIQGGGHRGANAPPRIPPAPSPKHMTPCKVILYIISIIHCYIPLLPVPNVPPPSPPPGFYNYLFCPLKDICLDYTLDTIERTLSHL